jgi:hypothetical protein
LEYEYQLTAEPAILLLATDNHEPPEQDVFQLDGGELYPEDELVLPRKARTFALIISILPLFQHSLNEREEKTL